MISGDGACYTGKNRKKVCIYYTVSKKLKDDFEEILLKTGWTYHTSVRVPRDRCIRGRIIKKENQVPCFEIRLRRNNKAIVKHLHKKEIPYKGKVFCLQLPRYHNFYVRRNGTGYFTGNSLAGSVVAAAAMVKKFSIFNFQFSKIKDSKKLTPKKREEFYKLLTKNPTLKWGIGIVSEKVIDKINIKNAAELAMENAVKNLEKKINKKIDFLIIDGKYLKNQKLKTKNHKLIVKADEKVFSCAAASILAKVTRDRIMERYHKKYPRYGFDRHKGYPTRHHFKMLKKFGPCKIHRKSFSPVFQCKNKTL
jgi:ribonuclease HII